MKKFLIFSILSVFCITFASCEMKDKSGEKGKTEKAPSHSHHRRYHSEPAKDS